MNSLGIDIGGANIKAADSAGKTLSRPFAIWKYPEQLASELTSICDKFLDCDSIAITMTAELADCFQTKSEGVRFILEQVEKTSKQRSCLVWTTAGRFASIADAVREPMSVAAANWHALATWIGRSHFAAAGPSSRGNKTSLLIDIGTTTTDIIPLSEGGPVSIGRTDVARLRSGELCYSGIRRTPLCALAHSVPFRDGYCALAAELFATTLDIYLLLDEIREDGHDLETANGKPATKVAAYDRIARSLCGDRDEISFDEALQIAKFLADVQRQRLAGALERVLQRQPGPCERVFVSGSGAFLARRLVADHRRLTEAEIISLDDLLSPGIAEAACAYALAQLARIS